MALLPPNLYFGKLIDAHLGAIGQNETPAMVLSFELTHAATDKDWQAINPTRRNVQLWLTDGAKEKTFADLRALGFDGNWDDPKFAADLYDGTDLDLTHDTYKGKNQEVVRIRKLRPAMDHKPVAADLKRTLAAQFKNAASMSAKPSTPPPARPAAGDDEPPL